jgi:tetratricopeptide (TPR) repeat protein
MPEARCTIEDAEDAYTDGELERTLELCEALLEADPDDTNALYLMGETMLELEEYEAAEEIFRDALGLEPESGALYNGLGVALFELCRFDQARKALNTAVEMDPRIAESRMYLGFFHERRGEFDAAREEFELAAELDPEHFHPPTALSLEEIQAAIELVMDQLPLALGNYLSGVPWRIEDVPATAMLTARRPPLSPLLTCLFAGDARDPVETPVPLDHAPDEITLFRHNFGKSVRTPAELPIALLNAVLFELEHYLSLDEAEIEALGLTELARGPVITDDPADEDISSDRVLH